MTRRDVLAAGAAAGLAALFAGCAGGSGTPDSPQPVSVQQASDALSTPSPSPSPSPTVVPGPPLPKNLMIIITDQFRFPTEWPPQWVEENLPSFVRLQQNGLTFNLAYTSASQCSPSRACLLTGFYQNVNEVQVVIDSFPQVALPPASQLANIATLMTDAGYDVVWKGKWHLSRPVNGSEWTEADIANFEEVYGFKRWNPPDAGTDYGAGPDCQGILAPNVSVLGGGLPANDSRYVQGTDSSAVCQNGQQPGTGCQTPGFGESVLDYLQAVADTPPAQRKPFCLIVSLVNPHDIGVFPQTFNCPEIGYPKPVPDEGIALPSSFDDTLVQKPAIQTTYRNNTGTKCWTAEEQVAYVNFYAYLNKIVDAQITNVLDSLDSHGLTDDTLIIRTADHGELGLSHCLIEKSYGVYEEIFHVPLVVSNPILFPTAQSTNALWSHVDLMATLSGLVGAPKVGIGVNQMPVVLGQAQSVQDNVVFSFDDTFGGISLTTPAAHIRAIRTARYTYALYFTATYEGALGESPFSCGPPFEFEMYDNQADPSQLTNLLFNPSAASLALWKTLHKMLTDRMIEQGALPPGWPDDPSLTVPNPIAVPCS